MKKNPTDETDLSVVLNVVIPALLAIALLVVSVIADVRECSGTWTQRSGNILIVVGAYIGYHEAKKALQFVEGSIYFDPELWYKILAIALVLIGTVISGYGDLIVRALT